MKSIVNWIANSRDWMSNFNRRFRDTRYALIDKTVFPMVGIPEGLVFWIHDDLVTVKESMEQYFYDDIKNTDIVFDIGANIGGFSLLAAQICDRVYAFEPVEYKALIANIYFNQMENVIASEYALGNGDNVDIVWDGRKYTVPSMTLTKMIESSGGVCDFLKMDVEGAEWDIKAEELKDIRRIEIEFHDTPNKRSDLLKEIEEYFDCTYTNGENHTFFMHGVNCADSS